MSTDALEQAKKSFGASFGDYSQEINATLIAIAEQLAEQTKHLELIRDHLDDIGSALLNAAGPDGAIKVIAEILEL